MKRFSLVTEILGGPQAETVKVCSATHMSRQNTDFIPFTSADVKLCEAFQKMESAAEQCSAADSFYIVRPRPFFCSRTSRSAIMAINSELVGLPLVLETV